MKKNRFLWKCQILATCFLLPLPALVLTITFMPNTITKIFSRILTSTSSQETRPSSLYLHTNPFCTFCLKLPLIIKITNQISQKWLRPHLICYLFILHRFHVIPVEPQNTFKMSRTLLKKVIQISSAKNHMSYPIKCSQRTIINSNIRFSWLLHLQSFQNPA